MTAMETATRITGPCSCHEVYASRGLIAPDCAFHDMAREISEALKEARREALGQAMNREKVIEVMARAVCRQNCRVFNLPFDCNCVNWPGWVPDMEAALTALHAKGLAQAIRALLSSPTKSV